MLAMPASSARLQPDQRLLVPHARRARSSASSSRSTTPTATGTPTSCTPTSAVAPRSTRRSTSAPSTTCRAPTTSPSPSPTSTSGCRSCSRRPGRPPFVAGMTGRRTAGHDPHRPAARAHPAPRTPRRHRPRSRATASASGCAVSRCIPDPSTIRRQSSEHHHRRSRPRRPAIDPARWPGRPARRAKVRRAVEGAVYAAAASSSSAVRRLPVRVAAARREAIVGGAGDGPRCSADGHRATRRVLRGRSVPTVSSASASPTWPATGTPTTSAGCSTCSPPRWGRSSRSRSRSCARSTSRGSRTPRRTRLPTPAPTSPGTTTCPTTCSSTFLDSTMSYSSALFDGEEQLGAAVAGETVTVDRPATVPTWDDLAEAQRPQDRPDARLGRSRGGQPRPRDRHRLGRARDPCRAPRCHRPVGDAVVASSRPWPASGSRPPASPTRSTSSCSTTGCVEGEFDAVVSVEMIEAVGTSTGASTSARSTASSPPAARSPSRRSPCRTTACWPRTTPTRGSTSTSSPAASCPRREAIVDVNRAQTSLQVSERLSFGQHYARDPAAVGRAVPRCARPGPPARLRRGLRPDVALLPRVLARRASARATSTSSSSFSRGKAADDRDTDDHQHARRHGHRAGRRHGDRRGAGSLRRGRSPGAPHGVGRQRRRPAGRAPGRPALPARAASAAAPPR